MSGTITGITWQVDPLMDRMVTDSRCPFGMRFNVRV